MACLITARLTDVVIVATLILLVIMPVPIQYVAIHMHASKHTTPQFDSAYVAMP